MIKSIIKAIKDFFFPQPIQRIDDLNRAVDTLIETAQHIVPEKRFAALKVAVEMLYKDHRLYKYHPCNRKRRPLGDPEIGKAIKGEAS